MKAWYRSEHSVHRSTEFNSYLSENISHLALWRPTHLMYLIKNIFPALWRRLLMSPYIYHPLLLDAWKDYTSMTLILPVGRAVWLIPAQGWWEDVASGWSTSLMVWDDLTLFSCCKDKRGDFVLKWKAAWMMENGELFGMTPWTPRDLHKWEMGFHCPRHWVLEIVTAASLRTSWLIWPI